MSFLWPSFVFTLLVIPALVMLYLRMQNRAGRSPCDMEPGLVNQATGMEGPAAAACAGDHLFDRAGRFVRSIGAPADGASAAQCGGNCHSSFRCFRQHGGGRFSAHGEWRPPKRSQSIFVNRQPSTVQIGVVAFSDAGFSVQLPTDDQEAILKSIDRLRPQRGTSLAQGIIVSLNAISNISGQAPILGSVDPDAPTPTSSSPGAEESAVIVLLTDGKTTWTRIPQPQRNFAADRGIRIHTIGSAARWVSSCT